MPHFNVKQSEASASLPSKVKILIVGAGMSGLYAAWRILEENPNEEVCILEKSWRTGGRLDSDLIHFKDGFTVKEEEGGMRFTFDLMDNLMALLILFDLNKEVVPFPMKTGGNNRLCFRGKSFNNTISAADNFSIWKQLYNLLPSEQNINPGSIIDTVFNRILIANPDFKERPKNRGPEFWQKFRLECKWKGVALIDWTLWNLFTDMGYSKECINLLYGLAGFNGTFLSDMNAGEAYQLLEDFPADPDFKTLQNGFSTLPNALVNRIGEQKIFLNTRVNSIDRKEQEKPYTISYTRKDDAGAFTDGIITAEKIILCIPRLSLEELFVNANALNILPHDEARKLWNALQTTTNQPLLKINLYFENAWWSTNLTGQPSVGYGPNFSDLPTGSVYPFYAIDEANIAALEYEKRMQTNGKEIPKELQTKLTDITNAKYNQPAALTIYCDFQNINFWKALQNNGPLFTSALQEEENKKNPQVVFAASQRVVEAAIDFFKQIFGTNYVPQPVLTSARIWEGSTVFGRPPSQQFGYGVHQWGLGANDREAMAYLTEPIENIFICGEAYSDYQGWVEGALRSANLVLQKGFGLQPINVVYEEKNGKTANKAICEIYEKQAVELIKKYITEDFPPAKEVLAAEKQSTPFDSLYGIRLTYFDDPKK